MLLSCARKRPQGLRPFTAGVMQVPGTSPLYLALERGYFRDAGLDVQPQILNSNSQMVTLLAAGRLDAAFIFASPAMFNAAARGSKVRAVLGREFVNPSCGDAARLYARKAAFPQGTADIRLWEGRRIVSGSRSGLGEFMLDSVLRSAGLDPAKTPNTGVSHTEGAAALVSGTVDALLNGTNIPYDFSSHPEIVHEESPAKAIAGLQMSHILFGPSLTAGDIRPGAAFVASYLRGLREFLAGATPQYLKDFVKSDGRDPRVLGQCRAYSAADGRLDMKSIQSMLDWAIARGYTPAGTRLEGVVDTRFLEIAHKEAMVR
jgi:NitT/TauT family transport system substrate-binding protein